MNAAVLELKKSPHLTNLIFFILNLIYALLIECFYMIF